MKFFKLYSPAGSTWPAIPDLPVSPLWSMYQTLDQTQWLSSQEIEKLQLSQVQTLLKHCFDNSEYYRSILNESGILDKPVLEMEDFRQIPFLTRQLYQNNFEQIKCKQLPNGIVANSQPFYTSGTNGVPIPVLGTNRDSLWWKAFCMRDWEWNGMNPRKRIASIRLLAMNKQDIPGAFKGISSSSWLPLGNDFRLFESGPAFGMDVRQDPIKQLEWLRQVRPTYLIGMPSNLEVLAGLIEESGKKLNGLEVIQIIGEPLTIDLKKRFESIFGATIKNLYSANETGYIASSCPESDGLHVHAENVLTEVLDENDNSCQPGETGRLVITSLTNFASPFIRYEILDEVTMGQGPCSCGRGLPFWSHVEGRRHPMLFLPNGNRRASTGIMLGVRQIGGIHQFQIIQKTKDHFVVKVIPNRDWTDDHEEQIKQYFREDIGLSVTVDIEKHTNLEGPGGKLKIIEVENFNA